MARTPRFDRGPAYRRRRRQRWLRPLRYLVPLALILIAWQAWNDPATRVAIGLPMEAGEEVSAPFPLCDAPGYSRNCVVDGDTLRIGNRRIRIEGIDAPEREGRCAAETAKARISTQALADWLNEGPFFMLPMNSVPRDQYGRELQTLWREDADGNREDLARTLMQKGHAERYSSSARPDWCG
ncbi:thermonuclease family protein [Alteraurantiacibacter aquimixticola]|nr:thermonuclease family protein [Alteraurantiacibacter aquimixticola]